MKQEPSKKTKDEKATGHILTDREILWRDLRGVTLWTLIAWLAVVGLASMKQFIGLDF